jgi:outer membrane immunogenic protein
MWYPVVLLATAASSIALASASGADLPAPGSPAPEPAPIVYNPVRAGPWTGFYFGGNIGYGWADANSQLNLADNAFANGAFGGGANLNAGNGGLQGGYNWQIGYLLLGVEGDIQISNQNRTFNFVCGPMCSVTEPAEIDWFGTFRGRVGYAYKDVLFYGTGGFNWTTGKNDFGGTLGGVSANLGDFSHNSLGWAAGVGIEWMFYNSLSAKVEYLHLQNDNSNSSVAIPASLGGGTLTDTVKASNNVVRFGLNYHFFEPGWPNR